MYITIYISISLLGSFYDIGGGLHGEEGYRGCLRNLVIDGESRQIETGEGINQVNDYR